MKKLENPTTHFFKQAENVPDLYRKQIDQFVNKIIDKDICLLCKKQFNIKENVPRIMIHCGHTFCTACLKNFYMNRRVRCPMCLKLVKHLDRIDRLPINHTIFEHIVQKNINKAKKQGKQPQINDASKFLFGQFQKVQKEAHMMQNPQKIDPDSGLPFCVFHPDRVQHFFCTAHNSAGCRVCIQIGHNKPECSVIDLYQIQNPQKYTNLMKARIQQPVQDQFQLQGRNKRGKIMLELNDNDIDDQFQDNQFSEDAKSV